MGVAKKTRNKPDEKEKDSKKVPHKIVDNAFKVTLDNPELFAQFLNDFVDIEMLKGIAPTDIEDITERFLPLITDNKDGDTIKKINLIGREPMYVISIVEHQSEVNYRMTFRMLEYIVYVLLDFEKDHKSEINRKHFKYPPVLPIVFYDGKGKWTAEKNFLGKVEMADIFEKFIPKFEYMLVCLGDYSKEDLIAKDDELSLIMLIDKLVEKEGFSGMKNLPSAYLENIDKKAPIELLEVIRNIVDLLMIKQNVPDNERKEFTDKILERKVSDMFAWADGMDLQEERRKTKAAVERGDKEKERGDKEKERGDKLEERIVELEKIISDLR